MLRETLNEVKSVFGKSAFSQRLTYSAGGKKSVLAGLAVFFGVISVIFANCGKCDVGEKVEAKKQQIDAVTAATPKPQENQLVITGTIICTSCDLKKQKGAGSQCSIYGCSYSIKTKKVINQKGQMVKEQIGKTYSILANNNSSALLQKEYKGKDVVIVGKIYPDENVLEVDFVKLAPVKKTYTCSMCGGEFDKPGKCPKCKMDLIEKK